MPIHFVVNIGDLLAHRTGGRWASTMHRVLNPVADDRLENISLSFFHQPDHDAVVHPLDVPPTAGVLAGRHLAEKVDRVHAVSAR